MAGVGGTLLVLLWLALWPPAEETQIPFMNKAKDAVVAPFAGDPAGVDAAEPSPQPVGPLWRVVDIDSMAEDDLPAYREVVQDRALVRLANGFRGLGLGDRLSIAIPQLGKTYSPVIERIESGPAGNRSYLGELTESDGRSYGFVITLGRQTAFAHLGTPQGSYELVAQASPKSSANDAPAGMLGWLMPTAKMDRDVDYSKPDYFIVEDGRRAAPPYDAKPWMDR